MEQKVSPLVEVEGEDMRRCFEDMILSWLSWLIETNWLVVCLILMSSTHSISLLMSGVWRSSREEFFGADGRDAFIEKHAPCLNFWRWLIWYYMDYVEYEWIWWILSSCPPRWFLDTWHLWFWLVHPEQARERERNALTDCSAKNATVSLTTSPALPCRFQFRDLLSFWLRAREADASKYSPA